MQVRQNYQLPNIDAFLSYDAALALAREQLDETADPARRLDGWSLRLSTRSVPTTDQWLSRGSLGLGVR
jgi:hypothetical protein